MKKISKGAEATIYSDNDKIIKKRTPKSYRIKEIDDKLRKSRTRREAKILQKLPNEICHPELIKMDDKNMEVVMSKINGSKIRDILDIVTQHDNQIALQNSKFLKRQGKLCNDNSCNSDNKETYYNNLKLCNEIGNKVAMMHNLGIIHGDLTTSNMIYDKKIFLIDFGLSYFSEKIEDKAVDIHIFRQAIESKHHTVYKKAYKLFLEGYKQKSNNYDEIIKRLETVESRGRNKGKE
jgi:tRNA A-37 threonylcarbamoyl transferase component Bud32